MVMLFLLTISVILVQGYHLGTDDGEIYVPAIKQVMQPSLYPVGADFFLMHARFAHMAWIVGNSARLLHLAADPAILLWHVFGVFLLLFAGWRTAELLFTRNATRWAAVVTLGLTMSVPVAGTALVIADPYFTARSLSTPLSLLALTSFLRGHRLGTVVWLLLTGLIHPQMVVYTVGLLGFSLLPRFTTSRVTARAEVAVRASVLASPTLWQTFSLHPATGVYHDLLYSRTFFFVAQWRWYEWFGVAAPLAILLFFYLHPPKGITRTFQPVCRTLILFGIFSTAVTLLFATSTRFDTLQRLQPMRSFDLIYILFFLILGGWLAEHVLRNSPGRWLALFLPLAVGMYALNVALYSFSPHIELPSRVGSNPWLQSFYWIRGNTPQNALFALNPAYQRLPREDEHGFRAVAERSRLADFYKDSGAATMFPVLAPRWEQDQQAASGWEHLTASDFARLRQQTGVSWVVLERAIPALACPYHSNGIWVCRID